MNQAAISWETMIITTNHYTENDEKKKRNFKTVLCKTVQLSFDITNERYT